MIARYRCENETRGSQYWREEERKFRVCERPDENLIRVLNKCEETKGEIRIKEFLSKKGKSWEKMRKTERE